MLLRALRIMITAEAFITELLLVVVVSG